MSLEYLEIFNEFKVIFLSVVIEAMPFLLIGAFVASLIECFVSDEFIKKLLPRNKIFQLVIASLLGIIFPVCECAIIPIARKLIKKGVPVGTAITFMFAVPIINPITTTATYFAFPNHFELVVYRVLFGFVLAVGLGFMFRKYKKAEVLLDKEESGCSCCGHEHHHNHNGKKISFIKVLTHTKNEFLGVGVFLIIGAILSALIQVVLPGQFIQAINGIEVFSIISMQILAYVLSLCSHADAFVASGLVNQFSIYAVLAFLLTSPLIDIKNTIVLYGSFKKRFSRILVLHVFCSILALIMIFISVRYFI